MDLSLFPEQRLNKKSNLDNRSLFSIYYHSLFGFPLNQTELIKWYPNLKEEFDKQIDVIVRDGLYGINDQGIFLKRVMREHASLRKMQIAKKAAKILGKIPTIKMLSITGSLAMNNAGDNSDIDFLIVCKKDSLWITRLLVYSVLKITQFKLRKPSDKNEKDKLCLNMWLDEGKLQWEGEKNFYTAHEICQIVPLINKQKTYERFLYSNSWVKDFWPNAVKINNSQSSINNPNNKILKILNLLAFKFQYFYMRKKITSEKISLEYAFFHPVDWSREVDQRINSNSS